MTTRNIGLAGYMRLITRRAGCVRQDTGWFSNLILDQGLEYLGTEEGDILAACQVGGANIPVADNQTSLFLRIATSTDIVSTDVSAQSTAPYYGAVRRVWRFATGVAAGTLAEVGISKSTSPTELFSRALIVDTLGNPTILTVLADEELEVWYELRSYPKLDDTAFTIDISGVPTSCVSRASVVTNASFWGPPTTRVTTASPGNSRIFSGAIGTIVSGPSGVAESLTSAGLSELPYVSGSHYRDAKFTIDLPEHNLVQDIAAMQLAGSHCAFQFSLDPPVHKDNTIAFSFTWRQSWSRYAP